jgi:hypothetical protein
MLDMGRAGGGRSVGGIELRGMTWRHRRAVDPLMGTLDGFRARHPGMDIAWDARPLSGFEFSQSPLRWELTNESFSIDSDNMVRVPMASGLGMTVGGAVIAKYHA